MDAFLSTLKSSTCKALFDKILTIDGIYWPIKGQNSALGLPLTPHRSNSSGTKIIPRLRSGGQTINVEGGETNSIIRINELKHNI